MRSGGCAMCSKVINFGFIGKIEREQYSDGCWFVMVGYKMISLS